MPLRCNFKRNLASLLGRRNEIIQKKHFGNSDEKWGNEPFLLCLKIQHSASSNEYTGNRNCLGRRLTAVNIIKMLHKIHDSDQKFMWPKDKNSVGKEKLFHSMCPILCWLFPLRKQKSWRSKREMAIWAPHDIALEKIYFLPTHEL